MVMRLFVLITVLLANTTIASSSMPGNAQLISEYCQLSADSLYKVFDKYYHEKLYYKNLEIELDNFYAPYEIKDAYYDENFKKTLLHLLTDSVGWCNYWIEKDIAYYKEREITFTNQYIKRRHLNADSIQNSPTLYSAYKDSSLNEYINVKRAYYVNNFEKELPEDLCLFIAKIHYPEAYDIFYKYWEKTGKQLPKKCHRKYHNRYYEILCAYQCPEIMEELENSTNTYRYEEQNEYPINNLIYGYRYPYRIKLLSNLLDKKYNLINIRVFMRFTEYELRTWNYGVFNNEPGHCWACNNEDIRLLDITFGQMVRSVSSVGLGVPMHYEQDESTIKELDTYSQNIVDNVDLIRSYLHKYYLKYLNEESYWLKNLPFNKDNQ